MRRLLLLFTLAFLIPSPTLVAQQHPNVARGFDLGRSYQMNGIDNVNLFNGSLTVTISVGQRYHVNGGLQYGLTLVYNSNVWDTVVDVGTGNNTLTYPNRRSNAGIGWLLSFGRLFPNNQAPLLETADWNYESPDGALHQFLNSGTVGASPPFFTSDGSQLRLVVNASDRTVEFPDGTSQVFQDMDNSVSPWQAQGNNGRWRLTQIKDRFGNAVAIQYTSTTAYPEIWTVNDGVRTQSVYFAPAPADSSGHANYYSLMLDHVVLTTFGAPAEQSRTWTMAYGTEYIRAVSPPHGTTPAPYAVPLLNLVTLPPVNGVSQKYSMKRTDGSTFYGINSNAAEDNGALLGLQLPTMGWLEWDYVRETFSHAPEIGVERSTAVRYRRTLSADRSITNLWTYDRMESADLTCFDPSSGQAHSFGPEQLWPVSRLQSR